MRRLIVAAWLTMVIPLSATALELETPDVGLAGVPLEYSVSGAGAGNVVTLRAGGGSWVGTANGAGVATFDGVVIEKPGTTLVAASAGGQSTSAVLRVIPGWVSVLPAVAAIAIALTLRNVIPALLLGLWIGATALRSFTPYGAGRGLLDLSLIHI